MWNFFHCSLLSVVLSVDPSRLGTFAIPDESFHILSVVYVMYSSDLLPAPLIFQRSMLLAIVENVLRTRCEYLYLHYFPSVLLQSFVKPVSSSANLGNLLINHCEGLLFHVIAPVSSLFHSVAVLSANFENVLYIRIPYLAIERF